MKILQNLFTVPVSSKKSKPAQVKELPRDNLNRPIFGKLHLGLPMQCFFQTCSHYESLNNTGNCPGTPYLIRCKSHSKKGS